MPEFDANCRRCPRLAAYLDDLRHRYPHYHCAPVAAMGAGAPRLLIVGLAPGLHGANASGKPFTGDSSGAMLFGALHAHGWATAGGDGAVHLQDCRVTNAVKCVPPANRPSGAEVRACNSFLASELSRLSAGAVVLALGRIAHRAVIMALGRRQAAHPFAHARVHQLEDIKLLDSYHCSRYNVHTGRLTAAMFARVLRLAGTLAGGV